MRPMLEASLDELLKATARSFYLTLRVLPGAIRPQIGLAYLLARATDTIADTEIVPIPQRLEALRQLRERILGASVGRLQWGELARRQGSPAEAKLLESTDEMLAVLETLEPADQLLIHEVLQTITDGQELDLRRFAGASEKNIIALSTADELDDYTYRVAGCVGQFWTRMCRAHLFPRAALKDQWLLENGVRFGKGLQLVNILRDLPADLRQGRCYVPADALAKAGLVPADLLNPANESRLRPFLTRQLDLAEAHLTAGWAYTNALPWISVRVRLACAWPILIGIQTLSALRASNMLNPQERVKINRSHVRRLMVKSVLRYPLPGVWRKLGNIERRIIS